MFAVRNRFANPQTQTLSPQFADLRTSLRKCPALAFTLSELPQVKKLTANANFCKYSRTSLQVVLAD